MFYLQVCPSFPNLNDDDDHFVLDMDSLVTLKTNALTTRSYEPSRKKCYFGDETNEIDGTGWSDKPIRNWCQEETINWLMSAASYIGQPYSLIQHSLAVPGNELVTFTKNDFINHDPMYGERLYDLLHSQHISNIRMYYYKSKIFQPVLGRRLVYQFGPNAKGWQTDNPNFRY
ncbi:hypothetical protein E2986_13262 [Frieseomelitta varia]|uniref:Uncharacterized protein n=1 Tax=Frieseomelitta varia TaxID=561572 RepID=A0A833SCM5_9HYME|nr:hypothetical protein E2986_13262 [Frieseomelitta varia]